MQQKLPQIQEQGIKEAMEELGKQSFIIDGKPLEACQCYYYSLNPPHVLFNDNCPELLKENIRSIFNYYQVELPLADGNDEAK